MYWRITAIGAPPQLAAQAADSVALLAYALMLAGQRMLPLGIQGGVHMHLYGRPPFAKINLPCFDEQE